MSDSRPRPERSILIINPNTTVAMTDALRPLVDSLEYSTASTNFTYFTAPAGVPSINNELGAALSTGQCLPALKLQLQDHDAFLVCCYSQHPLVALLRAELANLNLDHKPVTGIFEASIAACLQSIDTQDKFGIVSTGSQWEAILGNAVAALLGPAQSSRYAGTETTGLNADELHSTPKREVDLRIKFATKALLEKGARAVCLGCAGMDRTVREACVEVLGEERGRRIKIVDGVVSGVAFLEGVLRAGL
ncbi:Protein dcg1 [Friedmanniomyces endolithicus]|uniref:Protein dcg1 n=1 Tax=Friedmanniomyces endolithicus TaxID=329885 RepID=A0AAN6JYX1_9PEZI|nr:Protein dcg1 [Friedmanniomyces endolithicus]KAK0955258.1 Protein dcg1 [Friedmanniomyces endolithicus]KAK0987316.1 Protein dcg1 [Friedmanniomyces endolithicus]